MAHNSSSKSLLNPMQLGNIRLDNRIFMAPLTRSRSLAPDHTQTPLHALYYVQRASAGLIISEATQISQQGQGYAWTPGLFTQEQARSWRVITDAVHNAGGHIFVQLWHVGAISHNIFQPDQQQPVSASAWTPVGQAFVGDYHSEGPQLPHPQAKELKIDEIKAIIKDYKNAAEKAIEAGFDGIELHAANGYLIDQFMRNSVNKRTDEYGGDIESRLKFLNEVVDALKEVLPANRIGVRLTPKGGPGGSHDSDPDKLYTEAARSLAGRGLAYLHVVRPNSHVSKKEDVGTGTDLMAKMKKAFGSTFIVNGEFTPEEAQAWIDSGKADAIAFGRMFIANPDLPERISQNGPYNRPDPGTFYGGNEKGYTDYETLHKSHDQLKTV